MGNTYTISKRNVMISLLLCLTCLQNTDPHDLALLQAKRQEYKKQIAINGLFSIGLTAMTGIYYKKGNEAYDNYQNSMTSEEAIHYWEQTQSYDRIRNVCGLGALIFVGRTIYYYARFMDMGSKLSSSHSLDLRYSLQDGWSIGIRKELSF